MNDEASDPPPTPPVEPDAADCCGEGCARCVFDIYEEALARYDAALAAWRARQTCVHPLSPEGRPCGSQSPVK